MFIRQNSGFRSARQADRRHEPGAVKRDMAGVRAIGKVQTEEAFTGAVDAQICRVRIQDGVAARPDEHCIASSGRVKLQAHENRLAVGHVSLGNVMTAPPGRLWRVSVCPPDLNSRGEPLHVRRRTRAGEHNGRPNGRSRHRRSRLRGGRWNRFCVLAAPRLWRARFSRRTW
ncbi:MAG: hypothetical protein QOD80_12 [Verrucomicrobiota bacterium]